MNKLIEKYQSYFKWIKRSGTDEEIVILKDNAPKILFNSVMSAHGDKLPNDWIFEKYKSILSRLSDYTIESIDDIENYRSEIVDGLVDVYTNNLTTWLNDSNYNVYYIDEALQNYEPKDGFQLLAMAQYQAIDEIFSEILSLLEKEGGDE